MVVMTRGGRQRGRERGGSGLRFAVCGLRFAVLVLRFTVVTWLRFGAAIKFVRFDFCSFHLVAVSSNETLFVDVE